MNESNSENHAERKLAYEPPAEERPATAAPTEQVLEREAPTLKTLDYSPAPPAHDPYAAFRLRSFQHFIASFMLATLGTQIMGTAIEWDLAVRTNDEAMLGFLGVIQALPVILLSLPAGHVIDTASRKGVLVIMQVMLVICAIGLATLTYFAHGAPYYTALAFAIILVNAIALTVARPARQAYLPQIMPKRIFANAVTWNSTTFELATITGPAIGGIIIGYFGTMVALIVSAACTTICLLITLLLPSVSAPEKKDPMSIASLMSGLKFVFKHEFLLPALTLDLFAVLLGSVIYVLPFIATRQLDVGSIGFGFLRAAPSLGAVTMAMIIAHMPPMKRAGRDMLLAVIGFGLATIIFGLSKSFWLSIAMLFLTGAFDNVSVVVRHTIVQMMTPDTMRGRVSAVNQIFIGSSNYLGGSRVSYTAKWLGLVPSVVYGGIGTILVVLVVAWRWPKLRKLTSLNELETPTG